MTTPDSSVSKLDAAGLARATLGSKWLRIDRIPLVRREVRESLSESALTLLFAGSELIVEGERDLSTNLAESDRAYATVMLTLDLQACAAMLREPGDEATAQRVAELMRGSASVRRVLIELARPRLATLVDAPPRSLRIELLPAVRVAGTRILIDGDVVVSLRGKARSPRSPREQAKPRAVASAGRGRA